MKRRKNLERAIVLGLLLSTSVYGSAWAEDGIFENGFNKVVEKGNLEITTEKTNIGIGFNGIVNVVDGNLTVNAASNAVQSGYTPNATVTILANEVVMNSGDNGIFTTTEEGYKSSVFVGTEDRNITGLTINAGGQGIDNKNGAVTIFGNENSVINIKSTHESGDMENQAAINNAVQDGVVTVNGGSITLEAVGGNGITNGEDLLLGFIPSGVESYTTLNANNVTINASVNGIYNNKGTTALNTNGTNTINADENAVYNHGSGTITISATNTSGISALANYEKYDNELVGGINGVQSDSTGSTNVIADNNNVIAGMENGILSDGAGTITVTAGNNNYIGQYTDDEGNAHTSENGIYVTEGTVNITAENGNNNIYGNKNGIYISGENNKVIMTGKDNIITVDDSAIEKPSDTSGIHVSDGADYIIEKNNGNDTFIDVTGHAKFNYGVFAEKQGFVDVDTNNLTINAEFNSWFDGGNNVRGIYSEQSNVDIDADGLVNITVSNINKDEIANVHGIYAESHDSDDGSYANSMINVNANTIIINAMADGKVNSATFGVQAKTVPDDGSKATVNLTATGENGIRITSQTTGTAYGLNSADNAEINVTAQQGNILISANGGDGTISEGIIAESTDIALSQKDDVATKVNVSGLSTDISGSYAGIHANYGKSYIDIDATNGDNNIHGGSIGVRSENGAEVNVTANGNNNIYTNNGSFGLYLTNTTVGNITDERFTNGKNAKVVLDANNNSITNSSYGIYEYAYSDASLKAKQDNKIISVDYGIYTTFDSSAELIAGNNNYIAAGNTDNGYGSRYAVYALDDGVSFKGSAVGISANGQNTLLGAVYTKGSGVDEENNVVATNVSLDADTNIVKSAASIANAGGLTNTTVISALYAEAGAQINVSGLNNTILSYADYDKPEILERAVWAYDRADINIDGATTISTDSYEKSSNSNDIAIAAGTGTNLYEDLVNAPVADRSTVTLTYNNYANGAKSSITGNILSAYTGTVDIKAEEGTNAGIDVTGDLLAGNNGILKVDLGDGGILKGRADDYGDAGIVDNGHTNTFKDPAFSSEIHKGGEVNLTMGDKSRWNVTGQSWITSITTSDEEETAENNHIIDLISANTDRNETAHALTVYNFDGNATFNMSLDADRDVSDMLYIKNADGNYIVNVIDAVTEEDMYAARTDGGTFDGLRFATVGKDSTASFRAITYDAGFNNIEYIIGSDSYDESTENHHYNGTELTSEKPGDTTVDEFFENNGTPGSTTEATNGIAKASFMALAANETGNTEADEAENGDLTDVEVNTNETTNFKLIGVKNTELSDGGKTMLNMSRANYSNAIYMDRLNKRLGEARYINGEEDEGMWVRIRHDRIGKTDAYRSQNTMYELGYDKKQDCDNGERRVGFAVDYMHGDTGYSDIAGKGEIDRYGLWLYDTWMGDKGHYVDYVAKWGHLDNEFEIYNSRGQVTGDYSNNVFSISAEYGRKKDMGNDWYIEPQAQLQLARVTGADYVTSQGTKVSVDGINSLIGRAGFRLGKDFGEEKQSTVYIKADVLHEFLGDQDISALDATTNGSWDTISYENEGTWYDVGFGFATMMSKNSYAFLDLEKSFGHDNDETYQINAGVQWTF